LFPTIGLFPQISHTFAIAFSFYPIPLQQAGQMKKCINCVLVPHPSRGY
jgi:hypothetical protein